MRQNRHIAAHATHEPTSRPRLLEPDDRRASSRFAVVHEQAWIGWWDDAVWHELPARLLNLSAGGLMLVSLGAPSTSEKAWICLDGAHRTEWIEGVVLAQRFLPSGERELRLRFSEVCPYAFFDLAIYGDHTPPAGADDNDDSHPRAWW